MVSLTAFAWGSASHAAIIEGTFTLVTDFTANNVQSEQVVANGTFEYDDTAITAPLFSENGTLIFDNIVPVTDFSLTAVAGFTFNTDPNQTELDETDFLAFNAQDGMGNDIVVQAPVLVLSSSVGGTPLGLFGSTNGAPIAQGSTFAPAGVSLTASQFGGPLTFSTNGFVDILDVNGNSVAAFNQVSGDQVVPEPSAIALLGAGMIAFGAVRRRRRRA